MIAYSFIISCILITNTVITEGQCEFSATSIVFSKDIDDSKYTRIFAINDCKVKQEKGFTVVKGNHFVTASTIVKCQEK